MTFEEKLNNILYPITESKTGDKGLHDWFNKSKSSDGKRGWVQIGGPFAGKPCARQPGQKSTPKCGSSKMKASLSNEKEDTAFRRKNRQDPNQPNKTGGAKPTNVPTEAKDKKGKNSGKKDACYRAVKATYDVFPSAYASGALVQCRNKGIENWNKTKKEDIDIVNWIADTIEYDPDIISDEALPSTPSVGMEQPLSSTEINKQAQEATAEKDTDAQISKQMKAQEEQKKKEQQAKRKLIDPQIKNLQSSLNRLNTDISIGKSTTDQSDKRFEDMNSQITNVNNIISSLAKTL